VRATTRPALTAKATTAKRAMAMQSVFLSALLTFARTRDGHVEVRHRT